MGVSNVLDRWRRWEGGEFFPEPRELRVARWCPTSDTCPGRWRLYCYFLCWVVDLYEGSWSPCTNSACCRAWLGYPSSYPLSFFCTSLVDLCQRRTCLVPSPPAGCPHPAPGVTPYRKYVVNVEDRRISCWRVCLASQLPGVRECSMKGELPFSLVCVCSLLVPVSPLYSGRDTASFMSCHVICSNLKACLGDKPLSLALSMSKIIYGRRDRSFVST